MNTVQLQGVGRVAAKPAMDFRVGDKIAWNYGDVSRVLSVLKETPRFITFEISGDLHRKDPEIYTRRFKKDRLVAIG